VFPKRKKYFFKTKLFLLRKHLRNESVFEKKEKCFYWETFAKRKCFRNEIRIVLVFETFVCCFFLMPETKIFWGARMGRHTYVQAGLSNAMNTFIYHPFRFYHIAYTL